MSDAAAQLGDRARFALRRGVRTARSLVAELGVSQPTLSRALRTLGADLVPFGGGRSIQYAIRDAARQDLQAPVYRVSAAGQLQELGTLVPVHPQGYLGRAYNLQHGARLGLPSRLTDWNHTHVVRALLQQGDDLPGNLLLGDTARDLFVNAPAPQPIDQAGKA